MEKHDIVIIGGGPAGSVTAATARAEYPRKSILIINESEKGLVPCGIPYIFHKLGSVDKNKASLKPFANSGGSVLIGKVSELDTEKQILTTEAGDQIGYEKLVFATGSKPIQPNFIKGFNPDHVELISKSYSAMKALKKKADQATKVIVLGSGFTAVEVAEQLAQEPGKEAHLVFRSEHCLHRSFSREFAAQVNQSLTEAGVILHPGKQVAKCVCDAREHKIMLESGEVLEGDMVIAALGFEANVEVAEKCGIEINSNRHISVDNYLRTNKDNVYAVGDCSQTVGFITGRNDNIMLASTAAAEARVLGHNLFKIRIKRNFPGTLSVFTTEIHKKIFASAGARENEAKQANISFVASTFSDIDRHPGTFSDTNKLTVKLIVMPEDGQIIGGEVIGSKSSTDLINLISLAIQKHVTVYELISFQFGSHPLLTGAPTKNVLIKAAENAIRMLSGK